MGESGVLSDEVGKKFLYERKRVASLPRRTRVRPWRSECLGNIQQGAWRKGAPWQGGWLC